MARAYVITDFEVQKDGSKTLIVNDAELYTFKDGEANSTPLPPSTDIQAKVAAFKKAVGIGTVAAGLGIAGLATAPLQTATLLALAAGVEAVRLFVDKKADDKDRNLFSSLLKENEQFHYDRASEKYDVNLTTGVELRDNFNRDIYMTKYWEDRASAQNAEQEAARHAAFMDSQQDRVSVNATPEMP